MILQALLFLTVLATVVWLVLYMRAQKQDSTLQKLIQDGQYERAIEESRSFLDRSASDSAVHLHRAEALKLTGRFEESLQSYREAIRLRGVEAAAREGAALCLAHTGKDPAEARRLMEEAIQNYPEILEFQALSLAYILFRQGKTEESLRIFEDNRILLTTRFEIDYTDPDDLLAETLFIFAVLTRAAGDEAAAAELFAQVVRWAPGSQFARWSAPQSVS